MTAANLKPVPSEPDNAKITVDMDSLTAGEIERAEELSDMPITYALDPDKPKGKIMRAIACVVRQRTDPSFTWEQSADLKVFFGEEKAVPPTVERGSAKRSRSHSTSA